MKKKRVQSHRESPEFWLPVDSRIIPHIFSFGHVSGVARIFLSVEIVLTFFVVLCTLLLVVLKLVG